MVALSEELESQRRAQDALKSKRAALQLGLASSRLSGLMVERRRGGPYGTAFMMWRIVHMKAKEDKLEHRLETLTEQTASYEVSVYLTLWNLLLGVDVV